MISIGRAERDIFAGGLSLDNYIASLVVSSMIDMVVRRKRGGYGVIWRLTGIGKDLRKLRL